MGKPEHLHRVSAVDTHSLRGCALSHQKVIRQAKAEKWPYVLVVEDDALFYKNAKQTYEKVRQTLSDPKQNIKWDIVLGGVHYFAGKRAVYPPALVTISDFSATHFVLYRHTCYDVVLAWHDSHRHIDRYLGKHIRHILVTTPFLSYTSDGYSEIRKRKVNDTGLFQRNQQRLATMMRTNAK